MPAAIIQLFSSIECPYAYLATYRLTQVLPEYTGRVQVFFRALSLEYINHSSYSKPLLDAERALFAQVEPELPMKPWLSEDWRFPTTFWPAFEALACAQAQGAEATLAFSWALRKAYFAEGRNISLRHELLAIAGEVADEGYFYYPRFQHEWDTGRWKHTIVSENWRGWHELRLPGSATFILPDGSLVTNPGIGEVDFSEDDSTLHSYKPALDYPLDVYRQMLERALTGTT